MHGKILWHDIECGGYAADLPLWRELAEACGGPVLDMGCGTGRVALDLAAHGHAVTGLDLDAALLETLRERAGDLSVETVVADARRFDLGRRFPLAIAPMQTVQLLGGPRGRADFLARARAHLEPGGTLAMALAEGIEVFGEDLGPGVLPPDVRAVDGVVYSSQPVAVRAQEGVLTIERVRHGVGPSGRQAAEADVIALDAVGPEQLEDEGRAAGLTPLPRRTIEATDEHVGSTVVLLRG